MYGWNATTQTYEVFPILGRVFPTINAATGKVFRFAADLVKGGEKAYGDNKVPFLEVLSFSWIDMG